MKAKERGTATAVLKAFNPHFLSRAKKIGKALGIRRKILPARKGGVSDRYESNGVRLDLRGSME